MFYFCSQIQSDLTTYLKQREGALGDFVVQSNSISYSGQSILKCVLEGVLYYLAFSNF